MPKKDEGSKGDDAKKGDSKSDKKKPKKSSGCIGNKSPGPAQYLLPPLTGYPRHDTTKYRNPAFSLRGRQTASLPCNSPGPKYNAKKPPKYPDPKFSIGSRGTSVVKSCTPGPYKLPDAPRAPIFSIASRTNPRSAGVTPGPYNLPPVMGCNVIEKPGAPCFTFGARPYGTRCDGGPGPKFGPMNLDVVKPRAPKFSLRGRQTGGSKSCGPGPKYDVSYKCKCAPKFTFGIKHSECAPPLITECDDKC
ncbi:outer dense fiber protein 3-like [Athalia rosae]|uniref:outer dense fiber protein 3-like n=1 Tax=Athalia rosae TaxID=37344 RepID=UPI0006250CF1|nr:outer dense fiber protein 3-like [Athalia rosae]